MGISSKHQLLVFIIYIFSGIGCGVFFDMQRSLRRLFSAGKLRTLFEDILFAFVCTAGAIVAGFLFNRGQMRYYQVMGLISGILFYAAFLSSFAMKVLIKVYEILRKVIVKPILVTVKIILAPLVKSCLFFKKLYIKGKSYSSKVARIIKMRKNKVKKRMKML